MAFQIKSKLTGDTKEEPVKVSPPVNKGYSIVLEKYDGREISSTLGCIAKDLYCSKINVFTGKTETPELYINDYVLR